MATVVVGPGAGGETTTVSWDGGSPGQAAVPGAGTHTVDVGPLATIDGAPIHQITVTATTTDQAGASAAVSDTVTFELIPC